MKELLNTRTDPSFILQKAFAMSNAAPDDNIENKPEPTEDIEEDIEEVDDETADDDVDNDDDAEVDEDDDDADYEEEDESEDVSEDDEEPEDDPYESGYLYKNPDIDREVFLHIEDKETGEKSTYLNRKEAEKGILRQLSYIGELKASLEAERKANDAKLSQMQKDLQIYQMTAQPDQLKSSLIKSKMPEKFRNVDPKTLSDGEYPDYRSALLDAELAVEREIRTEQERLDSEAKKEREADDRANTHVKNRINDIDFFGLKNSEDRYLISKRMKEKPQGSDYSYNDIMVSIAKAYGNDIADNFIKAIVNDVISESKVVEKTPTKTTEKKVDKKTSTKAEKVEKLKKKVRPKKVSSNSSGGRDPQPRSARDTIMAAFNNAPNKKRR